MKLFHSLKKNLHGIPIIDSGDEMPDVSNRKPRLNEVEPRKLERKSPSLIYYYSVLANCILNKVMGSSPIVI